MGLVISKETGKSGEFQLWWPFAGAAGAYVCYKVGQQMLWMGRTMSNRAAAAKMLADRNAQHTDFAVVAGSNAEIMKNADVTGIREHLMKGTFTSVDLVNYFGNRCQTIGRELGLSTQELFKSGLVLAKKCDEERAECIKNGTQDQLPFLHGIPVSIKELFSMKGMLSTVGTAMLNKPRTIDSEGFLPLTEAGAIPIVRGNLPQCALSYHSVNYVWGRAQNVY
jgi:hypothetical protein